MYICMYLRHTLIDRATSTISSDFSKVHLSLSHWDQTQAKLLIFSTKQQKTQKNFSLHHCFLLQLQLHCNSALILDSLDFAGPGPSGWRIIYLGRHQSWPVFCLSGCFPAFEAGVYFPLPVFPCTNTVSTENNR